MALPNGFAERLRAMGDAEVLAILAAPGDYVAEAVPLARGEAVRRGLDATQLAVVAGAIEAAEAEREARAAVPLSPGMRLFCFAAPFNVAMLFAAVAYRGSGYKRKGRDALTSMSGGLLFYLVIAIVGLLLKS